MKQKIILSAILFLSVSVAANAQNNKEYMKKVETLDSTVETLYRVISGEKGEERDWELFKFLFKPGAKLIPSRKSKEGNTYEVKYVSPDDYVNSSGKWMEENGFHDVEIYRKVEAYGSIAHVLSTYQSFRSKNDSEPYMRGINSIQLLNDGARWWILNICWHRESEDTPIPPEYLGKN